MQSPEAAGTEEVTAVAMVAGMAVGTAFAVMAAAGIISADIAAAGVILVGIAADSRATRSDALISAARASRRGIRILARCAMQHSHRAIAMR